MDYQEAIQMEKEYAHLIGTEFKGKTISKLLIAPLKEMGIARLMINYANGVNSDQFYAAFSAFEVWVIFDIDDWLHTGVLDKMLLSELLLKIAMD